MITLGNFVESTLSLSPKVATRMLITGQRYSTVQWIVFGSYNAAIYNIKHMYIIVDLVHSCHFDINIHKETVNATK